MVKITHKKKVLFTVFILLGLSFLLVSGKIVTFLYKDWMLERHPNKSCIFEKDCFVLGGDAHRDWEIMMRLGTRPTKERWPIEYIFVGEDCYSCMADTSLLSFLRKPLHQVILLRYDSVLDGDVNNWSKISLLYEDGLISKITYDGDNQRQESNSYHYDSLKRVTEYFEKLTDAQLSIKDSSQMYFFYDSPSQQIRVEWNSLLLDVLNDNGKSAKKILYGEKKTFVFDSIGKLKIIYHKLGYGEDLLMYQFEYDTNDSLVFVRALDSTGYEIASYQKQFDSVGRLIFERKKDLLFQYTVQRFFGKNLLEKEIRTIQNIIQRKKIGQETIDFFYDKLGRLDEKMIVKESANNKILNRREKYIYKENFLKTINLYDENGNVIWFSHYDDFGFLSCIVGNDDNRIRVIKVITSPVYESKKNH